MCLFLSNSKQFYNETTAKINKNFRFSDIKLIHLHSIFIRSYADK
jgi:hypothetical protein